MDTKKLVLSTLAGTVACFLLGWLFYGIIFAGVFDQFTNDIPGFELEEPRMIGWVLSSLTWALLLAIIYTRWASISTFGTGLIAGAVIGLLTALTFDFNFYAMTNLATMPGYLLDAVVYAVMSGLVGGVVGWTIGKA